MPIETSRVASGVLYAKTVGQSNMSEMAQSRAEGMRLLKEAGDEEWVLIMDMTQARASSGPPSSDDMNVDKLRSVTEQNKEVKLLGYVVLGANPAMKLLMRTYGLVFRVDMYFENTYQGALTLAQKLVEKHRQHVP
jgi:hypothetical protein